MWLKKSPKRWKNSIEDQEGGGERSKDELKFVEWEVSWVGKDERIQVQDTRFNTWQ